MTDEGGTMAETSSDRALAGKAEAWLRRELASAPQPADAGLELVYVTGGPDAGRVEVRWYGCFRGHRRESLATIRERMRTLARTLGCVLVQPHDMRERYDRGATLTWRVVERRWQRRPRVLS